MKRPLRCLILRLGEQRGQTIVLLAVTMVVLLLFAGLAVDAGAIYVGRIHLSRSVDAASMAGIVELPEDDVSCSGEPFESRTCQADVKAQDFLRANGIAFTFFQSSREQGPIGAYRYRITVTHQINLFFLPLVRFNSVRMSHSARAEYSPWVGIYTDQSGAGVLRTVIQALRGRGEPSSAGDAFSPTGSDWYRELQGKYVYGVYVPEEYVDDYDTVRLEILDPDDYNAAFSDPITISATVTGTCVLTTTVISGCGSTCETGDPYQPRWFQGLDGGTSSNPIRFTLFYYKLLADGRVQRQDITQYTSQTDNSQGTDLNWYTPTGFDVQIKGAGNQVEGVYQVPRPGEPSKKDFFIYMEAESLGASGENGFALWAGPPIYSGLPDNVNDRNVYIVNQICQGNEDVHDSAGVIVYAVGHMSFKPLSPGRFEMQLTDIDPSWAGQLVRVDAFDIEGTMPPLLFYSDKMPQKDWVICYDDTTICNRTTGVPCKTTYDRYSPSSLCEDLATYGYRCFDFGELGFPKEDSRSYLVDDNACAAPASDDTWRTYEFTLPTEEMGFQGEHLMISYGGGSTDTATLRVQVEALPRLVQ